MKKLGLLFIVLVIGSIIWACSFQPNQEVPEERLRVTAVIPHNDDGYWIYVVQALEESVKVYPVDMKIVIPQLNYNIEQMTDLIKQATASNVDAIIVQGNNDVEYNAALKTARDKEIQIILIDTDSRSDYMHLYVGTDNYAAGKMMAQKVAEVADGKAKIAVLSGEEGYANLEERYQGFQDVLKDYPDMEIVRLEYSQFDSVRTMDKFYQIKRENPEVDTLVCLEGTGANTISSLVAKEDKRYRYIFGFDYNEEVVQGIQDGCIDGILLQRQKEMAKVCTEEICRYKQEGAYSSEIIYTDVTWVTADNLEEAMNEFSAESELRTGQS